MKTIVSIAAVGAALLIGSPAFAGHHHGHKSFHVTHGHKTFHHTPTYHKPTYHAPTYHQPVYVPTYKEPTYQTKKVEICFKWIKDGYGHATKVIIHCPEHVVIKKEVTIEKKEEAPAEKTEQPVEQK